MYLLNTRTGELKDYQRTDGIRYAILSHVWDPAGEQSYGALVVLWREAERASKERGKATTSGSRSSEATATNSTPARPSILNHPDLSPKIRNACKVARQHGYDFIWIDSCCINKESSAELSEAINSMYAWYRKADVCYAFLEDVPDVSFASPGVLSGEADFRFTHSRWHTRGWTLQELIAPKRVVFLSHNWSIIGSKLFLATTLHRATGVDVAILTGEAALESISVARRMSWASTRQTTRIEDQAYSLMGIFGVYMPTIYGEGQNAFLRLQQEIIKSTPDQSIFAWGPRSSHTFVATEGDAALSQWESHLNRDTHLYLTGPCWGILAPSPAYFSNGADIYVMSEEEFVSCMPPNRETRSLPDLHCSFTPQGIRMELLCISTPLPHTPPGLKTFSSIERLSVRERCACIRALHPIVFIVAVLRCRDAALRPLALLLSHSHGASRTNNDSKRRGEVRISACASHHRQWRTIWLPSAEVLQAWATASRSTSSISMITLDIGPVVGKPSIHSHISRIQGKNWRPVWGVRDAPGRIKRLVERELPIVIRIQPWCVEAFAPSGFQLFVSSDNSPTAEVVVANEDLGTKIYLTISAKEGTKYRGDAVVVKYGEHKRKQQSSSSLVESDIFSNRLTPGLTKVFVVLRQTDSDSRFVGSAEIKLPLGEEMADAASSTIALWTLRMSFEMYAVDPPASTIAHRQRVTGSPSAVVWVNMELSGSVPSRDKPSSKVQPSLKPQHTPSRLRRATRRSPSAEQQMKPSRPSTETSTLPKHRSWFFLSAIKRYLRR
ncbi:HET-domain-containing protein [Cubamyces sp. BRFM 1775]|nr:HET-domain-containing protein [Cubamyces sp. BRFM 1775]